MWLRGMKFGLGDGMMIRFSSGFKFVVVWRCGVVLNYYRHKKTGSGKERLSYCGIEPATLSFRAYSITTRPLNTARCWGEDFIMN